VGGYVLGKKILIIDDEQKTADKLKRLLVVNGYEVFWADDWAEGFEAVYRKKPDLIILDTRFPDGWGSRFFRMFTEVEELKKIPLIIKRGNLQSYIAEKKAVASFIIPYNPLELIDTVKKTIGV